MEKGIGGKIGTKVSHRRAVITVQGGSHCSCV